MPHWRPGETGTLIRRGPDGAETPVAFDTDHVEWPSPRYFWPLGRADDVVQVGGHNVSPSRVARHLEDDSRVAEAQVGLDGNSQRLTARVLPSAEGQALDPRDLRAALESRAADLRPAERPVRYRIASGDTERSREAG
jgi:4-coumarate--CoA ligase